MTLAGTSAAPILLPRGLIGCGLALSSIFGALVFNVGIACASFYDPTIQLPAHLTILALEHPNLIRPGGTFYSIEQLAGRCLQSLGGLFARTIRHCVGASIGGVRTARRTRVLAHPLRQPRTHARLPSVLKQRLLPRPLSDQRIKPGRAASSSSLT